MVSPSPPQPGVGWRAVAAVAVLALVLGAGAAVGALVLSGRGPSTAAPPPDGETHVGSTATADARASTEPDAEYAVWAHDDEGRPVRWDPCRPIILVVSASGGPDTYPVVSLLADVEEAATRLTAATGLEFVVEGPVDEIPDASRSTLAPGGGERWAPVLVGWREPGAGGLPLRDVDRGIGVPVAVGSAQARTYVTGQVALNPDRDDLRPGFDDRATSWGATVLHELAHVLGLDHVDDPDELMFVYPGAGPVELGPGDRAGLHAVGAAGGCIAVPAPRELDVEVPAP